MSDGRQHDFDPLVEAEEFERKRSWRPPLEGIDGRYDATDEVLKAYGQRTEIDEAMNQIEIARHGGYNPYVWPSRKFMQDELEAKPELRAAYEKYREVLEKVRPPELEPSGYNCVPETSFWQTVKLLFCGMVPRKFRRRKEHVTDDGGKTWTAR